MVAVIEFMSKQPIVLEFVKAFHSNGKIPSRGNSDSTSKFNLQK